MNDVEKIIRINAYIQRKLGTLTLDNKTVLCVALDYSCTFEGSDEEGEIILTDEQLTHLFHQTTQGAVSRVADYNRAIDERNAHAFAHREKPWLPLYDGE